MNDLRHLLRVETRVSHERVDGLYGELNLTKKADYRIFLSGNLQALQCFKLDGLPKEVKGYVRDASSLLLADLTAIGGEISVSTHNIPEPVEIDPVSALYVLGGANFGQRILQVRWERSEDPHVRRAGSYLQSGRAKELWSIFLDLAKSHNFSHHRRNSIVNSSNRMFDAYVEAFLALQNAGENRAMVAR